MDRRPASDKAKPTPPHGWRALLGGGFAAGEGCECQMLAMMIAERCGTRKIAEKDPPKPKIAKR